MGRNVPGGLISGVTEGRDENRGSFVPSDLQRPQGVAELFCLHENNCPPPWGLCVLWSDYGLSPASVVPLPSETETCGCLGILVWPHWKT